MTAANEFVVEKKPVFYWSGLISAILALITPVISGVIYWVWITTGNIRDDGWIAVFVFGIGTVIWILLSVISLIFVIIARVRKESGWIKLFAIAASVISTVLIFGLILFSLIASSFNKY